VGGVSVHPVAMWDSKILRVCEIHHLGRVFHLGRVGRYSLWILLTMCFEILGKSVLRSTLLA
jgi:hypothetical protein